MGRWIWNNISSLLLALVLAVAVWIVAIVSEDPTEVRQLSAIPIQYTGLPQGLLIVDGPPPSSGTVSIRAPVSVWDLIDPSSVSLQVDLSGLDEGTHRLDIVPEVSIRPARVSDFEPSQVELTIERAATASFDVSVVTVGEPQLGYRVSATTTSPQRTVILGPVSLVDQVSGVQADVNVTDRREELNLEVSLVPVDSQGEAVQGLQLDPAVSQVVVTIEPRERFRLVSVVPDLTGEEALAEAGYRLTDVSVTPEVVTVFSSDPQALESLPGFVLTLPLDLTGATGNLERRLSLDLPPEISPVEDQGVLVQVSISPVEGTITVTRNVEVRGLAESLFAQFSPAAVDIILTGPLPTLNGLRTEDVRIIVDLLDLELGTHQVQPLVIIAPTDVEHEPVFPSTIEVTISNSPPSPTPTP